MNSRSVCSRHVLTQLPSSPSKLTESETFLEKLETLSELPSTCHTHTVGTRCCLSTPGRVCTGLLAMGSLCGLTTAPPPRLASAPWEQKPATPTSPRNGCSGGLLAAPEVTLPRRAAYFHVGPRKLSNRSPNLSDVPHRFLRPDCGT